MCLDTLMNTVYESLDVFDVEVKKNGRFMKPGTR